MRAAIHSNPLQGQNPGWRDPHRPKTACRPRRIREESRCLRHRTSRSPVFANGAAYAAFSYAVAAAATSNELRGSVAQIQDQSDLVAPALEEATIDSVYADADRLGIDVPEGHEYSYSSKFAVGTLNANGTVNKGNLRFVDSLSEMAVDEVSFAALTSTKTGSTTYYRGSASPSLVESISTGSNGTTIALVRRNGISNAVFNVGHEVAHARGIRSEIVANRYGQRALQKYQLLNPPRPPGY